MLRREFMLAGSLVLGTMQTDETAVLATDLAEVELRAIQAKRPTDWQALSYIGECNWTDEISMLYLVSRERRLIDLFCQRLDLAMTRFGLPVFEVGRAGPLPGLGDGYSNVLLLFVGREQLARLDTFADLNAKYQFPWNVGE